jgi:hypothetical protein
LVWHETISALHAKGAKAAKESTQNETLSPTQVSPEAMPGHKLLCFFALLSSRLFASCD